MLVRKRPCRYRAMVEDVQVRQARVKQGFNTSRSPREDVVSIKAQQFIGMTIYFTKICFFDDFKIFFSLQTKKVHGARWKW